ncbi:hypothetical protein Dimus_026479, partial [Dionaea muscipula]
MSNLIHDNWDNVEGEHVKEWNAWFIHCLKPMRLYVLGNLIASLTIDAVVMLITSHDQSVSYICRPSDVINRPYTIDLNSRICYFFTWNTANSFQYYRRDTLNPAAIANDSATALTTHPPLVIDPNVEPNELAIAYDSATALTTHPPLVNDPNVEPNPRQLGQRRRRARERVERLVAPLSETRAVVHHG